MASNPLIGTWRLLSWENRSVEDGQVSYPLGEDATGYIMYNEDGYMFVAIMAPHRLRLTSDDLLSATKEEEAQAEETYLSYCGRYDFLGDTVVHHVELSLFPTWIGADQERLVDLRGERLTLSTRSLLLRGIQQIAHLIGSLLEVGFEGVVLSQRGGSLCSFALTMPLGGSVDPLHRPPLP